MSDLTLTPPTERSPLRAVVISVVVLGIVAAAVFLLNPRKTAELSVDNVAIFAPHTVSNASVGTVHILGAAPESEDDLYVVAKISMTDKIRLPLFITGTEASLFNGTTESDAMVVAVRDLSNLEVTFPALTSMVGVPFDVNTPIAPGETRTGTVVLLFPGLTEATWHAKKSAKITFDLAHQSPQTISLP